jgi:hypothetical protein
MATVQPTGLSGHRGAIVRDDAIDDPIESYLDRLLVTLPGSPRVVRHALAEAEAHLLDAAAAAEADGMSEAAARRHAVELFGPVSVMAGHPARLQVTPALRRRLILGVLLIGSVGGLAVGLAGALARIIQAGWGNSAIATPFPSGSYSAGDCARWLAHYPSTHDCVTAMTADHAADFLRNAAGCGVIGVLAAVAYVVLRRRWAGPSVSRALPRATESVVGVVAALGVAVVLGGQGVDAIMVTRGNGAGAPFALATAACVAALFFMRQARHDLTQSAATEPSMSGP